MNQFHINRTVILKYINLIPVATLLCGYLTTFKGERKEMNSLQYKRLDFYYPKVRYIFYV